MKLPIKTRILEFAIEINESFTAEELSKLLQQEYNGEKTASIPQVEKQLDMYARVGFLKAKDVSLDDAGELKVYYEIAEAGKYAEKYIPGHGNKYF